MQFAELADGSTGCGKVVNGGFMYICFEIHCDKVAGTNGGGQKD